MEDEHMGRGETGPAFDVSGQRARGGVVQLGLRENLPQFVLLIVINACVGSLVGLERTTMPVIGSKIFGLTSDLAIFGFIIAFGVTKATANLLVGPLLARFSRKQILIAGWLFGIPVPFVLAWAPAWWLIIGANVLLGINQGLAWSMTVNMKIDLVGPRRRGLATGLNEAAGYVAVGLTAFLTGYIAAGAGLRPWPELVGVVFVAAGLLLSLIPVRDTAPWVRLEQQTHERDEHGPPAGLRTAFADATWRDRSLRGVSQAGLVNNLNDGLTWGILPLLLTQHGLGLAAVGLVKGLYPILWGLGQVPTGHLADRFGRKVLAVGGLAIQAVGLALLVVLLRQPLLAGLIGATLLGIGTAMAYPALLAAATDHTKPASRATGLGVYRFWRDLGYAIGGLAAGILAAITGLEAAVLITAAITAISAGVAAWWIRETRSLASRPSSP
jgi:MFS family permease